ncbi:LPxTG domain-containing protein [Corynebacterium kutscheri]|uniref:LPxTG domain-containing protein n=1 Tax=Corynebacterium kutscheri TaxID=35755 RepID=A0AB38VQ89_9CORY|nr:DUF5979 domain-containing protein [Corynebacterium kutscheri]VEH05438.1 LPxTG domain-containing protein [Corynebacterium kutscheri]VEH80798.1 LPxTG domain-containing protein [Corynebacterium kutscheri]
MTISAIKRTIAKGVTKNPWLAVLFALLLIASSVPFVTHYVPAALGQAVCTGGSWSNVKWKDDSPNIQDGKYVGPGGFAEVQFDWKAKKEAKAGDKIEFDLPKELKGIDTGTIALKAYNGEVVATGQWDKDKKKFVITLTGFQDRNFDVEGKVFLAVTWDTSSKFDGKLNFTGCGNGSLDGKFEKREGGEFHDDSKIGEYRGFDDKNKVHTIQWSVGIDPKKHKNPEQGGKVTVTDTVPDGWKFACDGKYADGYAPVYVSSFVKDGSGKVQSVRHAIYSGREEVGGGTRTGVIGVTQDDGFTQQTNYNYKLDCKEQQVSVEFPYGLSEQAAPVLTLTAYTDKKPVPGSIVKNKAKIDNIEVEGNVRFPSAGGLGFGRKGGFTVEKNVVGTEEDKTKEYRFDYVCKDPQGTVKKEGTTKVTHESFMHIQDLDKGWKCTITENVPEEQKKGRKLTVSWVVVGVNEEVKSFGSASIIEFIVDDKFAEATHVVVTNKFEEATGSFRLSKLVRLDKDMQSDGLSDEVKNDFDAKTKDKKFKLNYVCIPPKVNGREVEKKQGTVEVKNQVPSNPITGLPIGTQCTITEDMNSVDIDGYTHEKLEWLLSSDGPPMPTPDDNGYTFTITEAEATGKALYTAINTYKPVDKPKPEPKTGGFNILKHALSTNGVGDPKFAEPEFKFTWECTPANNQGEKKSGVIKLKDKGIHKQENIPVGSTCTITEDETSAKIDGYTHKLVVKNEKVTQEGNKLTFKVESETPVGITAVNTYTPEKKPDPEFGQFTLRKRIEDDAAQEKLKDKKFTFDWQCTAKDGVIRKGQEMLGHDDEVNIDKLPLDASCTIKETTIDLEGYTHSLQWFTNGKLKGSENPVTISPRDENAKEALVVTAVNTYTKNKPELGQFTLVKEVQDKDARAQLKDKKFTFNWKCTAKDGSIKQGDVTLGNGQGSLINNLPLDASCVISETTIEQLEGYTHSLEWLTNGEPKREDPIVVSPRKESEDPLVVTAVNKYTPVVPPVPPTTEPTTEPAPTTSSTPAPTTEPTTEPAPTTESTTEPAPTTSSSTPTTEPAPTTEPTTQPAPTTSSTPVPTTEPAPTTSSTPAPTTSSTTSSSIPVPTTSSSQPIEPTTTWNIPPIIPIPIPIPVPPAPQPPVSSVITTQVVPSVPQSSVVSKPGKGGLANTGASVVSVLLLALLFAVVGGFIAYRGRNTKNS